MKKLLALLLAVCMLASLLAACGEGNKASSDPVNNNKAEASTDKYRSYYQVWIGAFCDSDGDNRGDLPGLISKLDYINDGNPNDGDDLGADGIWLSPMMPSKSYHKYNVRDYYNIDPEFGTLDDFDELIKKCHERGISVIIDLVLNHSGDDHEFFVKACEELREGKEDGYARYYNVSKEKNSTYGRTISGSDYYYEGPFSEDMPDWNLSYEGTREYFEDVTKFWLDRGVDGFRLDAVKYFDDSKTDGVEFLNWFYTMAQKYNPDVYMVGEFWDSANTTYDMYDSGIDSLFNFAFAGNSGEFLYGSRSNQAEFVKKLKKYDKNIKKHNENAINADFLSNHDMVRIANALEEDANKMAAALYMLAPGNTFTYYGEEIGMQAASTSSDSYYRTGMIWDNEELPDITVPGAGASEENPLGGVKQQLAQEDSLLNTYRKLIKIRQQNPEIARGDITEVVDFNDNNIGAYFIDYNGSRVLIIHNGNKEAQELTLDMVKNPELRGWSTARITKNIDGEEPNNGPDDNNVTLKDGVLSIPAKCSVVIKENK